MPIRAKGILITSMDIDPQHEDEFNFWYDREHLAERVAIDGFVEARRWVAHQAQPKYFATYTARFKNMIRVVGRITASQGQGRGSCLGVIRIRPVEQTQTQLREALNKAMDPKDLAGLISMHLIESDPQYSVSLTEPDKPNPGAADWFLLIEGTRFNAIENAIESIFKPLAMPVISIGTYQLMWDLAKSDL
jgi:hypothetical protein